MTKTPAEFEIYLEELRRIAGSARNISVDFRELVPTKTLTDEELATFSAVTQDLARRARETAEALLPIVDVVTGEEEVDDLFSLIALEITGKLRKLDAIRQMPQVAVWDRASVAMGLAAKILKGATAAENTLASFAGAPRQLSLDGEIEDAIAVRQAYFKLWTSLEAQAPGTSEDIEAQLRRGATAIARLTGRAIFLDLRFHDRRLLLAMQRRIRSWLSAGKGEKESGLHIWQDLFSLFQLLKGINLRIELVMHDQGLIASLRNRLAQGRPALPLRDPYLRPKLQLLLGREALLDSILLDQEQRAATEEVLAILDGMLQSPTPSAPSSSPSPVPSEAGSGEPDLSTVYLSH